MTGYDAWLTDSLDAQALEDAKADEAYQSKVDRLTIEIVEGITTAQINTVSEHMLTFDWSPEQYEQLDALIIKTALGLTVTPADIDTIIEAGDIVDLLVTRP